MRGGGQVSKSSGPRSHSRAQIQDLSSQSVVALCFRLLLRVAFDVPAMLCQDDGESGISQEGC